VMDVVCSSASIPETSEEGEIQLRDGMVLPLTRLLAERALRTQAHCEGARMLPEPPEGWPPLARGPELVPPSLVDTTTTVTFLLLYKQASVLSK